MQQVLVTGANGQLGIELVRAAWPEGWRGVALGRDALDLADPAAIVAAGHDGQAWGAVINGVAYTAVDRAENDQVAAWRVNALAPAALGRACAAAGIPLVQVSTNYVFPGYRVGAWEVDDAPAPLGVYGASKLGGELAVRASGARAVIVRAAWVVSAHGDNFVQTMLRVGAERDKVRVVDDQHGAPTAVRHLAAALATIAVRLADDADAPVGTFNFSNAGATSWASFAREIFRQSGLRGGPVAAVEGIATADYPTPARRPTNSPLSLGAIAHGYGITPRPLAEALGDILDELIGATQ